MLQDLIFNCLQCTHLLCSPNEPIIIGTKFMQMQVGKLPIVTSYCLRFLVGPKMILDICFHSKEKEHWWVVRCLPKKHVQPPTCFYC